MKVEFNIHYVTPWGQSLCLLVYGNEGAGVNRLLHQVSMQCDEQGWWTVELDVDACWLYRYALVDDQGELQPESGALRPLDNVAGASIRITDQWRQALGDRPFESSIFSDCYFKRTQMDEPSVSGNLKIRLYCPRIEPTHYVSVVGNQSVLGDWVVSKSLRMNETAFPYWELSLESSELTFPLEYKFVVLSSEDSDYVCWEEGSNHVIEGVGLEGRTSLFSHEHLQASLDLWRGTGVAIPVFSLRSQQSFGVGEFEDLKLMIDWAKKTGQKMIQILPINDTILTRTNTDSYPYNAVSVYALHPLYLRLETVGRLASEERNRFYQAKKEELNGMSFVDYQQVLELKWAYLKELYDEAGASLFHAEAYQLFFDQNKTWLVPYAVFSCLRDVYNTPDFSKWEQLSFYHEDEVRRFMDESGEHYREVAFYFFLQYHLHQQLSDVHQYAQLNKIGIKGDIPIGVSPFSVDVWMEPELFHVNVQAGAPPDDFSAVGQNWGFPTYNWDLMRSDGYKWWKNRFHKMAEYFDAYRIDHILGFFRIWEIPKTDVWGLKGSFYPALPYTVDQLKEKGVCWDESRMLDPYLTPDLLASLFGEKAEEVAGRFLTPSVVEGVYRFKPEFDTQRKIADYFESQAEELGQEELRSLRDGLYQLNSEVVFVRDLRNPQLFHPRISLAQSYTYQCFSAEERELLFGLYIDYYYHRHNEFWKQQAMTNLPSLINATSMLVCGEDLGMVPHSVEELMRTLEILSLEIQRMPKAPFVEFGAMSDVPYLSVCTTSTHDMNPIRAWWEENEESSQRYYQQMLHLSGNAPKECTPELAEQIIASHLYSKAMWVILPWQDWMSVDGVLRWHDAFQERINEPSNPRHFWNYRMHLTLEDLLGADELNSKIVALSKMAGRN